jgi:hypothetical protein
LQRKGAGGPTPRNPSLEFANVASDLVQNFILGFMPIDLTNSQWAKDSLLLTLDES